MKVIGPEDKEYTPAEKVVIVLNAKLKEEPNGKNEYHISVPEHLGHKCCADVKRIYEDAGWEMEHKHHPNVNVKRTIFKFKKKQHE